MRKVSPKRWPYRYLRPLMVLCLITGQFPVDNVLSDSSDQLRFKYWSIPYVTSTVFEVTASAYSIVFRFKDYPFFEKTLFSCNLIFKVFALQFFKLKTQSIIQIIKELDNLRQLPPYVRSKVSNPLYFSWILVGIFLTAPILSAIFPLIYLPTSYVIPKPSFISASFYMFYFDFSHYRIITAICLILYCTILAVDHLIWVWNCCVFTFLYKKCTLKEFCTLLENQKTIIKVNTDLLGSSIYFVIFEVIYRLLHGVCFYSLNSNAESMSIFNLIYSVLFFSLLVLTSSGLSLKFQDLSHEVFSTELDRQDLTRRNVARMKTIILQLEDNPGKVNAAGYGFIDQSDCLWYLSLAIEFLLLLWQNKTGIREFILGTS